MAGSWRITWAGCPPRSWPSWRQARGGNSPAVARGSDRRNAAPVRGERRYVDRIGASRRAGGGLPRWAGRRSAAAAPGGAGGVLVRGGDDLDVRVDAVVLHVPAVAVQPGCVPRHADLRAVGQFVERHVDADHAAPGSRPDDRAQVEDLDGGGDDVAVRA